MSVRFQTINPDYPLVLASASPRRKRLLRQISLPFRALTSNVEENETASGGPGAVASLLAEKKARAVFGKAGNHWILGADTLVVLGRTVLGKPRDQDDAGYMLHRLSGREHRVVTGFCLLDPLANTAHSEVVVTRVRFKTLNDREIEAYIASGEPFGKAGGYAIQGIGAFMVESISGSYTNVVGLPVCAVIKSLVAAGALKGFPLPLSVT